MNSVKTRSAQRVVRPFVGLDNFQDLLDSCSLKVHRKKVSPDTTVYMDSTEFWELDLELSIFLDTGKAKIAASEIGVSPEHLDFIAVAYGNTFRQSQVLFRASLADLDSTKSLSFHGSELPLVLRDSFRGFDVVYAVVLNKERNSLPLTVHQVGTWLVKQEYSARPLVDSTDFSPTPMDKSTKVSLGIPSKSMFFVQDGPESLEFATRFSDAITVWVDEGLLRQLLQTTGSASRVISIMLAKSAVAALVEKASLLFVSGGVDEAQFVSQDPQVMETALGRLVKQTVKSMGKNTDVEMAIQALKDDPQRVIACLDATLDILGELTRNLESDV
jgi:hypothetical protein